MSVSMARSSVDRLQKAIADLRAKDATEARKEADLSSKIERASRAAQSSKSPSTITAKINEMNRASRDMAAVQKKRADLAKSISSKTIELHKAQSALGKAEEADRKKIAAEQKKADDTRARQLKKLEQQIREQERFTIESSMAGMKSVQISDLDISKNFDVFVSHASEDKVSFVRPFVEKLKEVGINPFYDEMSLDWGDSLRRKIEAGLTNSRFGIVVLSKHFFAKEWPQRELDGLVALEMQEHSRILPIWHEISKDEVARFSPMMADKLAMNTATLTIDEIVQKLIPLCGKQ